MLPHVLIHVANVVYLLSYAVKDIRILRWLTVLGIVLLIPCFWVWHIWEAVGWNLAFLLINLIRLARKPREEQAPVSRPSVALRLRKLAA